MKNTTGSVNYKLIPIVEEEPEEQIQERYCFSCNNNTTMIKFIKSGNCYYRCLWCLGLTD